jgi:hypothetical protein
MYIDTKCYLKRHELLRSETVVSQYSPQQHSAPLELRNSMNPLTINIPSLRDWWLCLNSA